MNRLSHISGTMATVAALAMHERTAEAVEEPRKDADGTTVIVIGANETAQDFARRLPHLIKEHQGGVMYIGPCPMRVELAPVTPTNPRDSEPGAFSSVNQPIIRELWERLVHELFTAPSPDVWATRARVDAYDMPPMHTPTPKPRSKRGQRRREWGKGSRT